MAIGRNENGEYFDTTATAQRVIAVDSSGTPTSGSAPVARTKVIARYNSSGVGGATAPGTRTVTAGASSYTVAVVTAGSTTSPTLDGVALPTGAIVTYSVNNNDTLPTATLITTSGDDVIYSELR